MVAVSAWIKSLRLSVGILASFLTVTSFKVAGASVPWIVVIAVFFIVSATMLQNDWRDRFHDVRKGKVLVYKHPRVFLAWLLVFWIVSIILITLVAVHDMGVGITLAILAIIGAIYSEIRMIPFASIVIVSFASASPAVLPFLAGVNSEKLWLLFSSVALIIFAREITKDLDDKQIDVSYKWTIPLVLGDWRSRVLAVIAIVVGLIIAMKVSLIIIPAISFVIIGAVVLFRGAKPSTSRKYFDIGIALIIFSLITFV